MSMSAEFTTRINWLLENVLPLPLRDVLVKAMIKLFFKEDAEAYLTLKEKAYKMTPEDFQALYANLSKDVLQRETDLNQASIDLILQSIVGETVLDVGCGRKFLANKIVETFHAKKRVTGIDFNIEESHDKQADPYFVAGDIYQLPFEDQSFDTVICTHTLEHVLDIQKAIGELRRICRKKLIVVVPCQRECRYTFNLHIHFFPYPYSLLQTMGNPNGICKKAGLDLFYEENLLSFPQQ